MEHPAVSNPSHSPRSKKAHSSSASATSASGSIRTASGSRSSIPASRSPVFYNVLEKVRSGEPLTAKEKQIHDQGLVTVLRQIHEKLDEAVLEAYGWGDLQKERGTGILPVSSPENHRQDACAPFAEELLTRLVALNHERAAEEKRGLIRWLRPEYQNPTSAAPQPIQITLQGTGPDSSQSKIQNQQSSIDNPSSSLPWPDRLPEQVAIIRKLIAGHDKSVVTPDAEALSGHFGRKNKIRTEPIEGVLDSVQEAGVNPNRFPIPILPTVRFQLHFPPCNRPPQKNLPPLRKSSPN